MNTSVILFGIFIVLLICNIPIAVSLGIASIVTILVTGLPLEMFPINVFSASSKFALLAIPFFILAGNIMERAGISEKLIALAKACVGHKKNGARLRDCILLFCGDFRVRAGNCSGAWSHLDSCDGKRRVSGVICIGVDGCGRRDRCDHPAVCYLHCVWSWFRSVYSKDLYGGRNTGINDGNCIGGRNRLLFKKI